MRHRNRRNYVNNWVRRTWCPRPQVTNWAHLLWFPIFIFNCKHQIMENHGILCKERTIKTCSMLHPIHLPQRVQNKYIDTILMLRIQRKISMNFRIYWINKSRVHIIFQFSLSCFIWTICIQSHCATLVLVHLAVRPI